MDKPEIKLGVVIGRFQTPYLHVGHLNIIATAIRENDCAHIIVGCTEGNVANERNPYSFEERKAMINKLFPQVMVVGMQDVPNDDVQWSENIDSLLKLYRWINDYKECTLYHSRDSFVSHYHGIHKTKEVEEIAGYSATKIREALKQNNDQSSI